MKKVIRVILILCLIGAFLSACDMDHLPDGELIKSVDSPDGTYRFNAYLCDGGATTDYAVRGEVVAVDSGEKRNIYWQYKEHDAEITWKNNTVVVINGVELDVTEDSYDWRNE